MISSGKEEIGMRREIIPKVLRYQVPKWIWNILRTVVLIGLCFMILYPTIGVAGAKVKEGELELVS